MSSVVPDFVHRLDRDFTALLAEEMAGKEDPITLTQIRILDCVERYPGSTQTYVCMVADVDRSTLAEVVGRMVQRKLLARKRDKEDSRAWNLTITAKGSAELAFAAAARDRAAAALVEKYPGLKKFAEDVSKKRRLKPAASSDQAPRMVAAE